MTLGNNKSDTVDLLIDLIEDITEQMNLLVINTAIEANATHGKSRSLVIIADELKRLAEKTQTNLDKIVTAEHRT